MGTCRRVAMRQWTSAAVAVAALSLLVTGDPHDCDQLPDVRLQNFQPATADYHSLVSLLGTAQTANATILGFYFAD